MQDLALDSSLPHDTYLGLPTVIGRNKYKIFSAIKDRVWKRVQGWRRSLFSAGGREVLIKPGHSTYVMSMFRLPNSLYSELRSILIHFWWGTSSGNRKIAWVKWSSCADPNALVDWASKIWAFSIKH